MGTDEISVQQFGGLVEIVKTLLAHQAEIKIELTAHQNDIRVQLHDSNKRLFEKIETIGADVVQLKVAVASIKPVIEQHDKEIENLKSIPIRLVTVGCAVISAIGGALAFWKGSH